MLTFAIILGTQSWAGVSVSVGAYRSCEVACNDMRYFEATRHHNNRCSAHVCMMNLMSKFVMMIINKIVWCVVCLTPYIPSKFNASVMLSQEFWLLLRRKPCTTLFVWLLCMGIFIRQRDKLGSLKSLVFIEALFIPMVSCSCPPQICAPSWSQIPILCLTCSSMAPTDRSYSERYADHYSTNHQTPS